MPRLSVYQVNAPEWLGSTMMYYRLAHVDLRETRFYTLSRWNMPPSKLFRDRLESRLVSASGGSVSREGRWRLIVHMEDFSQHFVDDANSEGRIALRVSVLDGDGLVARQRFLRAVPAPAPDAPGGARALSVATDEVIADILRWLTEIGREQQK